MPVQGEKTVKVPGLFDSFLNETEKLDNNEQNPDGIS
jgi:hypothetical protein